MSEKVQRNPNFIDICDYKPSKTCSLYRAVCWLAYGEKPLAEGLAELVYPFHEKRVYVECHYEGSEWIESELQFISSNEEQHKLYLEAQKAIRVKLYNGELSAKGYALTGKKENPVHCQDVISNWYPIPVRDEDDLVDVPKKIWASRANISWLESEISCDFHEVFEEIGAYTDIQVETESLLKAFTTKKETDSNSIMRGRKPKYDWHNHIYPEIAIYIHENGNVDNANKMAEDIYAICSQKYGEENTPDIETIRKIAAAPIVRRFKFGNN